MVAKQHPTNMFIHTNTIHAYVQVYMHVFILVSLCVGVSKKLPVFLSAEQKPGYSNIYFRVATMSQLHHHGFCGVGTMYLQL